MSKRKQGFLDTLLSSTVDGKPLTTQDLFEEVSTFIFEACLNYMILMYITHNFGNAIFNDYCVMRMFINLPFNNRHNPMDYDPET